MKLNSIILLCAISTVLVACGNTPGDVASTMITSVDKGDYAKFAETIDTRDVSSQKLEVRFRTGVERLMAKGGVDTIDVECEEKTDFAICKTTTVFKNKEKDIGRIKLVRVDGKWKAKLGG